MKNIISPEILGFLIEVNANLVGSNVVIEWEPTEINAFKFELHLRNEYYYEPLWSPMPKLFELLKEKAAKYFGKDAKLNKNNTGTIIWFYFE